MTASDDKHDDEDPPSRRESHFNNQRSSLRSDQSEPIHARSRPQSTRRLEDFDLRLDIDTSAPTDRADSETLPSPSSPAPNVPYSRSRQSSNAKGKGRSRAKSSRGRSKSTPDEAHNPYELLSQPDLDLPLQDFIAKGGNERSSITPPSRGSRTQQQQQQQRASRHSAKGRSETPGSQLDITALPSMTATSGNPHHDDQRTPSARRRSRIATELYTISYLIFFAILGTLARLGLQALTFYPGAPVAFSELWANVAGTFVIGFLSEDRRLFHEEWGQRSSNRSDEEESIPEPEDRPAEYHVREKKRHGKVKKTIPLYIGLATGFCGCFTSFSSFERDVFLALANDSKTPISHPYPPGTSPDSTVSRNGGYSFMAVCAIILITLSACYAALRVGAHFALFLEPYTPVLPFRLMRRFLDPLVIFLGFGTWIGAVIMTAIPPSTHNAWRGQALFALVFAPPGCLARYYISLLLNPLLASFPLGTFSVNIFGTAVLGMSYDLQRVRLLSSGIPGGSVLGCQVLQGIEDGFCGCLTTVSTWILEIDSLKRRHAYVYGLASVGTGLGLLVAIMGGVRWSIGWEGIVCVT